MLIHFGFKLCYFSLKLQCIYLSIYQGQYINMIMITINSINLIKKGCRNENTNLLQLFFSILNTHPPLLHTYCWFPHCSKYTLFLSQNTSCWQYFKTFYTSIFSLNMLNYVQNVAQKQLLKPACLKKFTSCAPNQSKVACFQKDGARTNQKVWYTPLLSLDGALIRD